MVLPNDYSHYADTRALGVGPTITGRKGRGGPAVCVVNRGNLQIISTTRRMLSADRRRILGCNHCRASWQTLPTDAVHTNIPCAYAISL
jgi:hypothetical protein